MIEGRDFDWNAVQDGVEPAPCVPVRGDHPAYILYTSGTTGAPKGVVRPTGGHLVALNWTMKNVYNVDPGDVFWAASDVVGRRPFLYLLCATYSWQHHNCVEGNRWHADAARSGVISEHNVRSFLMRPTAFRAIKRDDPKGEFPKI